MSVLTVDLETTCGLNTFHDGFDEEHYATVLTCTTRLFLVGVLSGSDLGDSLAVRDLRSEELDFDLIVVVDMPFEDVDVLLTHTVDDGLAEFLRVLDTHCRILCTCAVEGLAEFLLVFLVDSFDGATIFALRILDRREYLVITRNVESLVVLDSFQLDSTSEVAGCKLGNSLFLLASYGVESGDALLGVVGHVDEVNAFTYLAGENLEVNHVAEVLLESSLVNEQRCLARCIFLRSGSHFDEEFHKTLYADVLLAAYAEYRIEAAVYETDVETFVHLFLGELACVEEFLHQGLVALGCHFHQLGAHVFGL